MNRRRCALRDSSALTSKITVSPTLPANGQCAPHTVANEVATMAMIGEL